MTILYAPWLLRCLRSVPLKNKERPSFKLDLSLFFEMVEILSELYKLWPRVGDTFDLSARFKIQLDRGHIPHDRAFKISIHFFFHCTGQVHKRNFFLGLQHA